MCVLVEILLFENRKVFFCLQLSGIHLYKFNCISCIYIYIGNCNVKEKKKIEINIYIYIYVIRVVIILKL